MKKSKSKTEELNLKIQNAYNDFIDFVDSLFYEGYAGQLATENPEQFTIEFNEYFNNYFKK